MAFKNIARLTIHHGMTGLKTPRNTVLQFYGLHILAINRIHLETGCVICSAHAPQQPHWGSL